MYQYKTKSGNVYPLEVGFKRIESAEIIHDYLAITNLCLKGCKNYNFSGGCPPRAPKFATIQQEYKYAVLMYARLDSIYKSPKIKKSNNYYIHYRSQDVVLSNFLTNQGYSILDSFLNKDIVFLNNGYCMGCGSKRCAFKNGEKLCRNIMRRTFSLEATGINVVETLSQVFDLRLQWYNRENYSQIEYMIKAVGFFCKSVEVQEEIFRQINDLLGDD